MAEKRGWLFFVLLISGLVVVYGLLYVFNNAFQTYVMRGQAMSPTVDPGDVAVVNNLHFLRHEPQLGDIVTYRRENDETKTLWLHRIVGIPGQTISISNKVLSVNGTAVEESFVTYSDPTVYPDNEVIPAAYRARDHVAPLILNSDEYFVLGDNRDQSFDSRYFGVVKRNAIKGKVIRVFGS